MPHTQFTYFAQSSLIGVWQGACVNPTSGAFEARVLVVDDEPNIIDVLRMSLEFVGFEVETAANGRNAVAYARQCRPDIILLDVMLPDFDGFEVVRRLRADGITVPVVFLTARDSSADAVKGLTAGGDDYVSKPFSLEEVVARVRAVLRRSRGEPTPGTARRRRRGTRRRPPHGDARRHIDRPLAHGVRAAALSHAEPQSGALDIDDPESRLALRLRG